MKTDNTTLRYLCVKIHFAARSPLKRTTIQGHT